MASKEIGGRTFSFGMLPATAAVRVEVAIAKVIGEPLFKAFMDVKDKKSGADGKQQLTDAEISDQIAASAGAAIGLLTSRMDADDLIKTMETVFQTVRCDGLPINIDQTFTEHPRDLWQVFIEALKVNFGDFLTGGLSASIRSVMPK